MPPPMVGIHHIGQKAINIINVALAINRFIGELTIALLKFCVGMARTRWFNVWDQISKAGYQALPLISMIGYLIGLILAFIGSIPLKMFGADIFVASLVGIGVLRLMSPVMVGTVMAGRTGASFAAELGSMNVNDEIDAFQAMGVSPMDFLVLPRFLALCVMVVDDLHLLGPRSPNTDSQPRKTVCSESFDNGQNASLTAA